jgi:hypothetical protein
MMCAACAVYGSKGLQGLSRSRGGTRACVRGMRGMAAASGSTRTTRAHVWNKKQLQRKHACNLAELQR